MYNNKAQIGYKSKGENKLTVFLCWNALKVLRKKISERKTAFSDAHNTKILGATHFGKCDWHRDPKEFGELWSLLIFFHLLTKK